LKRIIAKDGRGFYHITTNKLPHEAELYAASTLYRYLYKATGSIVPFWSALERCPRRSAEILIGNGVRGITVDTSALKEDGFIIRTVGEDIVITGRTPRGTIYGVYRFLELFIGFRCFTKDVETFDRMDELIVEDLDITDNPAFEYREVYFRSAFDPDFCVKNALNSNMAHIPKEKGGKLKFFNCHHSFNELVPPEVYFESHPEYFALVNGERLGTRTQPCLTSEGVFQVARANLRRWISENPDCRVFSVAQNDWHNYCTCPACRALDEKYGTPAASVLTFVNRLADDIREDYPDVLLHTFAYQYTRKAPLGLSARDNVIVRLCNIECSWDTPMREQAKNRPQSEAAGFVENLAQWGKLCKHLYIWDYACNFSNYLMPFPNYHSLPENLRTYRDSGVTGMLQQGNFSYGEASGLTDLEIYLAARLMWNPDRDADEIIDEFIRGVYGEECFPYLRAYIDLLLNSLKGHILRLYAYPDAGFISDELVQRADGLFEKALSVVKTERGRNYLEKEYLSVLFIKAARMEPGNPERDALIDRLYAGVKSFGISEIRERRHLENTFEILRNTRYAKSADGEYNIYYVMR